MERNASLRLILVTEEGKPPGERVEIRLRNHAAGDSRVVEYDAQSSFVIENLGATSGGLYSVEILSPSFRAESRTCEISGNIVNELCIVLHPRNATDKEDENHCPPLRIANQIDEPALSAHIATRIAGTPADGAAALVQPPNNVIWVDRGDEVLVHLDSIRTAILDGTILVSIDLETDQTGRATMVIPFAVGRANDPAGLVAVTEEFPRGNGVLASRWGSALQAAAWSSLLSLANDHASERFSAPIGITAAKGTLTLAAGAPLKVTGAAP